MSMAAESPKKTLFHHGGYRLAGGFSRFLSNSTKTYLTKNLNFVVVVGTPKSGDYRSSTGFPISRFETKYGRLFRG